MQHESKKTHYKKCEFRNCGLVNRRVTNGTSFHSFPVNDPDRCITWLINSGLDDWVEMSNTELQRKYICSRHFSKSCFHASGRLKKNAVPNIYDVIYDNLLVTTANTDLEVEASSSCKGHYELEQRLAELEGKLKQEKAKSDILRLKLRAKCRVINRLQEKITSGTLNDTCLKKAIAKKVNGFVLAFILMLLFKTKKSVFSPTEKQICMTMHYTSPLLYSKLRDSFGFHLPSPASVIRWFDKIDVE
ncbi:hypothetical protein ANTPLA_LOCUS7794 [Anthophora plagiata]